MPIGSLPLRATAIRFLATAVALFPTLSFARTVTLDTPPVRFEVPDTFTAKDKDGKWTLSPADGKAAITFQVRPLAARGGPYADAEQATEALAKNVQAQLHASITRDIRHRSPHYAGRYLEFTWQNKGTDLHNIEIYFESDGRLLNFTLIAPHASIESYRNDFLAIAGSLQPAGGPPAPSPAATPPAYTEYFDAVTGLHIPLPATWKRADKPDKILFYNPTGDDLSSLLIQHLDAPGPPEDAAREITARLHQVLQKNSSFKEVEARGKVEANGLDLYVVSAVNTTMKKPGKDVFIQVADGRGKVVSINFTIDLSHAKDDASHLERLLRDIRTGTPRPENKPAVADADALVEITGVVKHTFGSGAGGVTVTITLITSFDPLTGTVVGETKTDSRGRYTFKVRDDLPYLVHAGERPELYYKGVGFAGRRLVDLGREDPPASLDITLTRKR